MKAVGRRSLDDLASLGRVATTEPATVGSEGAAVNQAELRQMAEERLKDAKTLIEGGRWEFAYYAAGYAVECSLKSCILSRMIHTGLVFDEEHKPKDCLIHDLDKLVSLAGLRDKLDDNQKVSNSTGGEFAANWATAKKWKVTSRYEAKTEDDAKRLYAAIADEPHGVLRWIESYW